MRPLRSHRLSPPQLRAAPDKGHFKARCVGMGEPARHHRPACACAWLCEGRAGDRCEIGRMGALASWAVGYASRSADRALRPRQARCGAVSARRTGRL